VINHDGRPTIVDAPLTLIFMVGQRAFHFLLFLYRQPILRLRLSATCHPPDYPRYTTNNRWRCVDAHSHDGARRVSLSLLLKTRPIILLWLFATCHHPDYPRYTTNNHWSPVDTHFQDGAGRLSQSILSIRAATHSFMTVCNQLAVGLPRTHDQISLTLRWRSISRWRRERVALMFANKGG